MYGCLFVLSKQLVQKCHLDLSIGYSVPLCRQAGYLVWTVFTKIVYRVLRPKNANFCPGGSKCGGMLVLLHRLRSVNILQR